MGSGSEELNGTFDMMGNVKEWAETPANTTGYEPDADRLQCGGGYGSFGGTDGNLASLYPGAPHYPHAEGNRVAVTITLNGGLGTSMGLTGPKSLLTVKEGKRFLDIILRRAARSGVRLALMNSYSTEAATLGAVAAAGISRIASCGRLGTAPWLGRLTE